MREGKFCFQKFCNENFSESFSASSYFSFKEHTLSFIKKIILKEEFEPQFIGLFTNPFYFARKGLLESIKKFGTAINGQTLDVGCGSKPYEKYFFSTDYVGLEIETTIHAEKNRADFFYDGKKFPFDSGSFDSVVTNQVLEHVFEPDNFLKEIHRALKPNGKLLLTVPFVWDEHEQPYDYARYSSFGLKHLLEKNNFKIIRSEKSVKDYRVIAQMFNAFIYKTASARGRIIKILAMLFLIAPCNILGTFVAMILPSNEDLYLDNIILAEKI